MSCDMKVRHFHFGGFQGLTEDIGGVMSLIIRRSGVRALFVEASLKTENIDFCSRLN